MFGLLKRNAAAKGRVGIAIAANQLAVAVVHRDGGAAPVLERCEVVPLMSEGVDVASAAVHALHLPRVPVSSVLSAEEYQLAMVEAPDVPPAELRAAMRWKLRDAIDFRVEEAVIDVFDVPSQSRGSHGRMMYAIAARRSAVERHTAVLKDTGSFDVVDVPELCLRNIVGMLASAANGVAMVHLGESTATVVLVRGKTFYFARQMNLQTNPAGTGDADSERTLNADHVTLELQRSLDYYERHFDQPPITRIVFAPIGARAALLAADLGKETGLEASVLDLNTLLQCRGELDAGTQSACLLAVGAALRQEHRSL